MFRNGHLEKLNQIFNEEKVEQNGKLKAQEEEIEKLQKMVHERDKKIRMHEKKERAHLKKRKGKNPFGFRSRVKKSIGFVLFYSIYCWYHNFIFYI